MRDVEPSLTAHAPVAVAAPARPTVDAPDEPLVRPASRRRLVWLFSAASFTGAALVFMVQPMVAKMILPRLGGSPAVWNTSMVFFQALLLAGYSYAHFSYRGLGPRRQPLIHAGLLLLPLALLPIALPAWTAPSESVELWVLALLAVTAGAPYFAVTTAGPLLQRWFATTDDPDALDPYFLYATGNVGSMVGLLAYPALVEPFLPLAAQARLWAGGYVVFVALVAACAVVAVRSSRARTAPAAASAAPTAASAPPLSWMVRLRWIGLAFLPSSLMLGVTTYLSTDVAAVPLLWIVPLVVYLATFIVAFSRRWSPLTLHARRWLPLLVLPALIAMGLTYGVGQPVVVIIALHLVALLGVGMAAHGRLADERPPVERLTEFFLLISVGGVLGGLFNALIAPVVFNSLVEYPLVLLAALLTCTPQAQGLRRRVAGLSVGVLPAAVLFVVPLVVGYLLRGADVHPAGVTLGALVVIPFAVIGYRVAERPARVILAVSLVALAILPGLQPSLHTERTFFGVHRVTDADGFRQLAHGTTLHGAQSLDPDLAHRPTTYYSPDGPVGDVMATRDGSGRIGGIGLGTGAIAAYASAGQPVTFFEIDPAVVRIAEDDRLFTFLSGSRGDVDVVVGDGRLSLTEEPHASFDVLILDAFSSDAVPVHLLTREAVALYRSKLAPGGVMAFNISNRHLDLEPVLGGIAGELGLAGLTARDGGDGTRAHSASQWVVLADSADLEELAAGDLWSPLDTQPGGRLWTDDFSNILRTVKWW